MPRHVVDLHFGALKVVEFLPDGSLVSRREPGPRFVGVAIVVDGFGDLDVVVEPNDAFLLELLDGGSEGEFSRQDLFRFFPLSAASFVFLVGDGRAEDVALFEFFGGGAEREATVESDADDASVVPPHFLRDGDENVPLEELLLARSLAKEAGEAFLAHYFGGETASVVVAVVVAIVQRVIEKVVR